MTTPMLNIDHPTEEVLTAFLTGELDATARQETMRHLAGCGECRELLLMTTDFLESEKVVTGKFGKGRIAPIAAALAVAAGLAVAFLPQWMNPDIDDVAAAARHLPLRVSDGRLSRHAWQQEPPNNRNAGGLSNTNDVAAKAELYEIASEAKDPHVRGVALLYVAEEPADIDGAIETLEEAYAKARPEQRDAVAIDLAAALVLRARWQPERAARAYELSNGVYARTRSPEAAWNRAAALEKMKGREAAAIAAYEQYLKIDPQSQWANEAKRRISDLRELSLIPPARPPA